MNTQATVITRGAPTDPVEVLRVATWERVCGLRNALRTRQAHPTYGITKADLRERLAHLEGTAHALDALQEGFPSASVKLGAQRALETFDVALAELVAQVDQA